MPALVARCSEVPVPPVPSQVVQCANCDAPCWLSLYSGASTLALAALTGDARIMCWPCLAAEQMIEVI